MNFIPLMSPSISEQDINSVVDVLRSGMLVQGANVAALEAKVAEYLNVKNAVAVSNGTATLHLALAAAGVGAGDEVIVPANTFFATAEAVGNVGAKPVFVDIEPQYYHLDPAKIEEKITGRTKAIIPVHLYGLPVNMDAVMAVARKHKLKILEDCAQAHGATYKGQTVGTFGDVATFSFYPSKNLGAFGDAGAIVTNSEETAEKARLIANHGQFAKNRHVLEGRNSRLDGIQAAVLSVKLPHLESWLEARRSRAALYDELLRDSGLPLPIAPDHSRHTYHLYVVRVPNRDQVQAKLAHENIETGTHYPIALPFMEAYASFEHQPTDFPIAFSQMSEILSLPMYAELTDEQIEKVCTSLKTAVALGAAN